MMARMDVRNDTLDRMAPEPGNEASGSFSCDALPLPRRANHPGDLGDHLVASSDSGLDHPHQAARLAELDNPVAPDHRGVGRAGNDAYVACPQILTRGRAASDESVELGT